MDQPTLRDTIEDAVEEHAPEADSVGEVAAEGTSDAGQEGSVAAPAEDTAPAAAATDGKAVEPAGKPAEPVGKPADAAAKAEAGVPGTQPPASELKAPSQWRPQVKEKWAQLPREVQEEVLRREHDTLRLVGTVGHKIKFSDDVSQALAPLSEKLQMNNVQPQEFVRDVFSTVTSLATGDMKTKAETIANIINSYGIDVRVLDQVLSGRMSAPPPDPRVVEAQRQTEFYRRQAEQVQQQEVGQVAASATQTLTQFSADPKNEFFEDVRDMMADLLETGRSANLADAYTSAVWANPDTRQILLQREAQARATTRSGAAQRARRASSAIHGAPHGQGGGVTSNPNASLRESLEAAFEEHSS